MNVGHLAIILSQYKGDVKFGFVAKKKEVTNN